jgi:hypothetical protein
MEQVGPEEELEDGGFFGFGEKPELPVEVVLAVLGLLSGPTWCGPKPCAGAGAPF